MPRARKVEPLRRGRGRPALGDGAATQKLNFRATKDQRAKFEAAAKREGVSLSAWIVSTLTKGTA